MKIINIVCSFTFFWLLAAPVLLIAQKNIPSDYLVLNSGDTLYGSIKYIDDRGIHSRFLKKIRLTDRKGKTKKHTRKDVATFSVNQTIYEGFWLKQSSKKLLFLNPRYDIDSRNGEHYFLKVMHKGRLSHYHLEWWEQGNSTFMFMDLLKKENDTYFIRATQGLFGLKRKVLTSYFNDCPNLQKLIQEKLVNEVNQVVDYYIHNCIN